ESVAASWPASAREGPRITDGQEPRCCSRPTLFVLASVYATRRSSIALASQGVAAPIGGGAITNPFSSPPKNRRAFLGLITRQQAIHRSGAQAAPCPTVIGQANDATAIAAIRTATFKTKPPTSRRRLPTLAMSSACP